jgi:hypothetical protein
LSDRAPQANDSTDDVVRGRQAIKARQSAVKAREVAHTFLTLIWETPVIVEAEAEADEGCSRRQTVDPESSSRAI